jgi:signal transduction histidine kinase
MKGDRQVRVAIVDRGVGICTTLQRRHPDTTPDNALQRVLEGKYSAQSRPNNAGLGLSILRDMISYAKGDFVLISDVSGAHCKGSYGNEPFIVPRGFPGTAAFFTLPVGGSA